MNNSDEQKKFSVRGRLASSNHALRGIRIFFKTTHNAWVYPVFVLAIIYLGDVLQIAPIEWEVLVIVIGFVFVTEAINTAIEIDIDLTSPEYHPSARDTKDVAAGAVLLSIIFASTVGVIIFIPKVIALFH